MQGLAKTLIPLFGLVAAPLAVQAAMPSVQEDGLSYNYLEAAYVFGDQIDIDDVGDFDLDGFRFKGSAALTPEVFVWGSSHNFDVEIGNDDVSVDTQSLGVGYRFPLVTGPGAVDLWGGLSYERADAGTSGSGYGATLGLRWLPIPELELSGFAGYRDFGDLDDTELDGSAYGVGAAYHVTNNLALLADWERWALDADFDLGGSTDIDVDAFSVGVRWNIR
jgi:hypothetical protein